MTTYEVECPLCESMDYQKHPDGHYECYVCSTSWGSHGTRQTLFRRDDLAQKVHEKLQKYTSE